MVDLKHLNIRVRGRVQGVFFRLAAKEKALALGLAGVARNEPGGSVLVEVEGPAAKVDAFADWCRVGPPEATVREAEIVEAAPAGLSGFIVR